MSAAIVLVAFAIVLAGGLTSTSLDRLREAVDRNTDRPKTVNLYARKTETTHAD